MSKKRRRGKRRRSTRHASVGAETTAIRNGEVEPTADEGSAGSEPEPEAEASADAKAEEPAEPPAEAPADAKAEEPAEPRAEAPSDAEAEERTEPRAEAPSDAEAEERTEPRAEAPADAEAEPAEAPGSDSEPESDSDLPVLTATEEVVAASAGTAVTTELSAGDETARILQPGARVGSYTLAELIGVGARGAVHIARHDEMGGRVALRLIAPRLVADSEVQERLVRESFLAAALDHPGIVEIIDVKADGDVPYMVMELFEGAETLEQLVGRGGALPAEGACRIMIPVLYALDTAHDDDLVHGDPSPGSLLIRKDGRVKLGGFGLPRLAAVGEGRSVPGVAGYVAPEVLHGEPPDVRSDIYTLGCTFYYACTGKAPFDTSDLEQWKAAAEKGIPEVGETVADFPADLDALIQKMAAPDPEARFAGCSAVLDALEELGLTDAPELAAPPPPPVAAAPPPLPRPVSSVPTPPVGFIAAPGQRVDLHQEVTAPPPPTESIVALGAIVVGLIMMAIAAALYIAAGTPKIDGVGSTGEMPLPDGRFLADAFIGVDPGAPMVASLIETAPVVTVETDPTWPVGQPVAPIVEPPAATETLPPPDPVPPTPPDPIDPGPGQSLDPPPDPLDPPPGPLDPEPARPDPAVPPAPVSPDPEPDPESQPSQSQNAPAGEPDPVVPPPAGVVAPVAPAPERAPAPDPGPAADPEPAVEPEPEPPAVEPEPDPDPRRKMWPKRSAAEPAPPPPVAGGDPIPEPAPVRPAGPPRWIRWKKDGAVMVLVPEGVFRRGYNLSHYSDEKPEHDVLLSAYYIDVHEVTREQFRRFLAVPAAERHGACPDRVVQGHDDHVPLDWVYVEDGDDHPVTGVGFYDALAYAAWAGKSLPSDAQWEKAGRGDADRRVYPWGDELEIARLPELMNARSASARGAEEPDGYARTAPVGGFAASDSPYGVQDMLGNAAEWVLDDFDVGTYRRDSVKPQPPRDPVFPTRLSSTAGRRGILRGGSYMDPGSALRLSRRHPTERTSKRPQAGLRCVVAADGLDPSLYEVLDRPPR